MRITAHVNVVDGKVACPSSGQLENFGHCTRCVDLRKIEGMAQSRVVVCMPDVESFETAVERVMRA